MTIDRSFLRSRGPSILLAGLLCFGASQSLAFDLQAHRGGRGLAPENTLAAFRGALALGVSTIETDLAITADDIVVIAHDPRLNPDFVRDESGRWLVGAGPAIRSLRLADLRRFDIGRLNPESRYSRQWPQQKPADGERFPTLKELFALVAQSGNQTVRFNIETKLVPDRPEETADPQTFARLVVATVREAGMQARTTLQSFDWRTLIEAKKLALEIETVCLSIESDGMDTVQRRSGAASAWHAGLDIRANGGSLPRLVKAAGCGTWSMFWRNLTPELAAEARGLGLKLVPWTVNETSDMAKLIELGVDGLITDYPDRLRRLLQEKGLKLP
jgi:glycerophosphoryl diester phosphodiesterase